jgi:hypothetical protein
MSLSWSEAGTRRGGKRLHRHTETGSANTLLTSTFVADGNPYRVVSVTVAYSASPTQAGVTTAIDSGAGAAYDAVLNTGTANARYTSYEPNGELSLGMDDGLVVTAPAGGAGITASVTILLEDA